jgi:hypothetical protein
MKRAVRIAGYLGIAGLAATAVIGHFLTGEGGAVAFFSLLALLVCSCICVVVGLVGRWMTSIES